MFTLPSVFCWCMVRAPTGIIADDARRRSWSRATSPTRRSTRTPPSRWRPTCWARCAHAPRTLGRTSLNRCSTGDALPFVILALAIHWAVVLGSPRRYEPGVAIRIAALAPTALPTALPTAWPTAWPTALIAHGMAYGMADGGARRSGRRAAPRRCARRAAARSCSRWPRRRRSVRQRARCLPAGLRHRCVDPVSAPPRSPGVPLGA
jgi:hypothetical protein